MAVHLAKTRLTILGLTVLTLPLAGCPSSPSGGGITIAQNDATGPTLTMGAGQPGGQNVTVSSGGPIASMTLTSRTGPLNLLAVAQDSESGIQTVEIWVNTRTTSCQANGGCSTTGPGLLHAPRFDSTTPQKSPGETTAESSTLAQALDLTTVIPQQNVPAGDSLSVDLTIYATAVNHVGKRTVSPVLTATFSES